MSCNRAFPKHYFCHPVSLFAIRDNSCIRFLWDGNGIDTRKSAVYNTRHRPLTPRVEDGKILKEVATAGEKYTLPYGLEKLDYSYKTIFVTEGIFDSCFLKNCLAYSNWTCPTGMNKVVQMFRDHGYQIIHIFDNFQEGDKGGRRGLDAMVRSHDWLQQGDRVFDWTPFTGCKDLNEIAMKHELDEIPAQTIIDHSWNEEEARANYKNFMPTGDNQQSPGTPQIEPQEEVTTPNQLFIDELLQDDEYGLELKSTVTAIEEEEKPCKSPSPNHLSEKDYRDNSPAMQDLYDDLDEMVENDTQEKPQHSCSDDELEALFEQMEQEQKQAAEQAKERERMKKRYEAHLEQEMREMERTAQKVFNPQSYLWKTPGITISPSKL